MIIKTAGTYWVETDGYGCAARDSFVYKLDVLPDVSLGNDTSFCRGGAVQYTLAIPEATYQWQDGNGSNTYTVTNAGTYKVFVINAKGCKGQDSVVVGVIEYPLVSLMRDTAICENDVLHLGADVLQYTDSIRWTPATGISDTRVANPSAQPAATTIYTLTAYNAFCATSDDVRVQVNARPQLVVTNDAVICRADSLPLQASGAANYSWLPNTAISDTMVDDPVVAPLVTTRYIVTGTAANGCSQTQSVLVTVQLPASFGLEPATASICAGDTITLTATGGDAYDWLFATLPTGSANAMVKLAPTIPGTYNVIAYDNTCHRSDTLHTLITIHPLPVITVSKSNDIDCIKGEAYLTAYGASYYQWYPAATLSGANTYHPLAKTDSSILYHVKASSREGCVVEDSVLLLVLKNNVNTYPIASAFTPNGDGLNDCFGVTKWGLIKQMELAVYNRMGERVFVTNNTGDCWNGTYKGELQPPGTYVYTIKAETLCGTVIRNGTLVLIR